MTDFQAVNKCKPYVGKQAHLLIRGVMQTVTITDVTWDETVWNLVTQSDGDWRFWVTTKDGETGDVYRHNLTMDVNN